MKNKIWKTVTLLTEAEQKIIIQPTPELNGITLSFCELDGTHDSGILYLYKNDLPHIVKELQKLMEDYSK